MRICFLQKFSHAVSQNGKGIAMKLLIIRHGESEADLLDVHEGRVDFPLTWRGHKQAEAMAEYVAAHYQVSKIYCSPLRRAKETAQHLSDKVSAPLMLENKLMEFNNGLIAGLKRDVAKEKYPVVSNLPLHEAVYEQESKLEFRFRAEFVLSKIISECSQDETITVVTHGGMINQLYRAFLRLPIDSSIFFITDDTGVHEWLVDTDSRRIIKSNYTAHTNGI